MRLDLSKAATEQPGARVPPPGSRPLSRWLARPWTALVPGVTALVVTMNGIARPSFNRDESATMLAVHRGYGQLIRMLANVDVVHGAYYSLIWVVTHVIGSSALAVRFPSALAAAVTAAVVTLIGQRLVSGEAGLAAGLVYAALPPVSGYAEVAREYAMVAAFATVASYLLVLILDSNGARRWLVVAYGATLAALGLTNIFGLLVIGAHAVALAAHVRGHAGPERQRLVRGWLVAAGAALLAVSPVALAGLEQISLVGWIKRPGLTAFIGMSSLVGTQQLAMAALTVIGASVVLRAVGGLSQLRTYWPPAFVALAVPWLILPPLLLFTGSYLHPVYVFRYVAYCIPASALLLGAALVALGRVAAVAGLAVIVALGLPAQAGERGPIGHGYAIRQIDQIVARRKHPGDVLLNVRFWPLSRSADMERQLEAAYPFGLSQLRDVSEGESPVASATLGGTFAPAKVIRQRLTGAKRVWVTGWSPPPPRVLTTAGFTARRHWHLKQVWLWLYERQSSHPRQ